MEYYSDSTEKKGFGHKQMGLAGSDDTVSYFNFMHSSDTAGSDQCMTFDAFAKGYNAKADKFKGQSYDFPYSFCINRQAATNGELILILYNPKSKKADTLRAPVTGPVSVK